MTEDSRSPDRCDKCGEWLAAWVDGEMPDRDRRRLAGHVVLCDDCAAEAGQMMAEKVLVSRPEPVTEAPRQLWSKVVAEMDRVDGVQRALAPSPRRRRSLVPALSLAGILLVIGALHFAATMTTPSSVAGQLLAAHAAALSASHMYNDDQRNLQAVSTSYAAPSLVPVWQAVDKFNSSFAVHKLYMAGRTPVSVISVPQDSIPVSGMSRQVHAGSVFFVADEQDGAVVVYRRDGMAEVIIGNTTVEDLLPIALELSHMARSPLP
jgi:hypothetical protein